MISIIFKLDGFKKSVKKWTFKSNTCVRLYIMGGLIAGDTISPTKDRF